MTTPEAGRAPLRVLHAMPTWLPQTATWLHTQLRALPGWVEAHVVCDRTENLEQFPVRRLHSLAGVPRWRRVPDYALRRLGVQRQLHFVGRTARRVRPQVVHSHFGPTGWQNVRVARRAGARHVVTFYGVDVQQVPRSEPAWRARYRELFATADAFLCEGPHMARCLVEQGCPPEKVRVHPLGVEVAAIPFRPRRLEPGEPVRVLLAGTFREKKGLPDAIEALGRLAAERPVEVTLIGGCVPREARSEAEGRRIEEALRRAGLADRVRRLGFQPHRVLLEEAYRHHLFLSPSRTAADGDTEGGAPVTITELAASGMPVVSTTHCDIPFVLAGPAGEWLAPEAEPAQLAARLRALVASPGQWEGLTAWMRGRVEEHFDAATQGERLAGIYRELVA